MILIPFIRMKSPHIHQRLRPTRETEEMQPLFTLNHRRAIRQNPRMFRVFLDRLDGDDPSEG
jgi:hypothetical protein